ncbi:CPSF4 [Hepatospora eriocheir]|uniref:mRNA 3'-end-processing protein n=1 Tax=Hepatospora eriocheir TaxID=1081669 RepID=A0A1X0QG50_9MICR|nr:CPSF4 [Hepatospora eriocheir]
MKFSNLENISKKDERLIKLDFDDYIANVLNLSETKPVYCPDYQKNSCKGGCGLIHIKLATAVVCKHWLKGLCKKNEECTFLHDYDLQKMPECFFFNVYGVCNNYECPYKHVDDKNVITECPWYNKGFCKNGPTCKYKHIKRSLCVDYSFGLCLKGPKFNLFHLKELVRN